MVINVAEVEGVQTTVRRIDHHATSQGVIEVEHLNFYYGRERALRDISVSIPPKMVTAIMGPSGCGKSTFLRTLNRMYELIPGARAEGEIRLAGEDIFKMDPVSLRSRIGMVFQQPNPFPKSIYDNIAYGPRVHGIRRRTVLNDIVEQSLRRAALWDQVKDKLRKSAFSLSGGQQQRLCIARALAVRPQVLLMDEPCSSLDPQASAQIEATARELAEELTVVIVTHNLQQAARVSDYVGVFLTGGVLTEFGPTEEIFEQAHDPQVRDYLAGRFG
jgi:phosphate transport system ATP-binding protein